MFRALFRRWKGNENMTTESHEARIRAASGFYDDARAEREACFDEPRYADEGIGRDDEPSPAAVYDETSVLCEPHAHAFGVSRCTIVCEARQQDPDEPIQCEACSLSIMRSLGVI
jgi:hypothetical protein